MKVQVHIDQTVENFVGVECVTFLCGRENTKSLPIVKYTHFFEDGGQEDRVNIDLSILTLDFIDSYANTINVFCFWKEKPYEVTA